MATIEGKKDILMDIAEGDQNNMFNLTEAVHKPLGERLAQRIKEILQRTVATEITTTILPFTSTTTTPEKELMGTGVTADVGQQNEVVPSLVETEITGKMGVSRNLSNAASYSRTCGSDAAN